MDENTRKALDGLDEIRAESAKPGLWSTGFWQNAVRAEIQEMFKPCKEISENEAPQSHSAVEFPVASQSARDPPEFLPSRRPSRWELQARLMDYNFRLLGVRVRSDIRWASGGDEHLKLVIKLWNDAIRDAAWSAHSGRDLNELLIKDTLE